MRCIVDILVAQYIKWNDYFMFSIVILHFHIFQINYWTFDFCVIIIMIDHDLCFERFRVFHRLSRFLFNFDLILFEWIEFTSSFSLCLKCSKHILDLQFDCKHDNSTSTKCRDCVQKHQLCFSMKELSY